MQQDKSNSANQNAPIVYRKRIYKIRGISYMGLSLTYIVLLVLTAVIGLALLAYYSTKGKVLPLILVALIGGGLLFSLFHIGVRYGEYGLEIILGKALQKRHIKNDFPLIERQLLSSAKHFEEQTLSPPMPSSTKG